MDALREIDIELLVPGVFQPRKSFDQEAINELAESIKRHEIIQPIVVRKLNDTHFEIIAGERRWRAAQVAGLHKVPCLIKDVSDAIAASIALTENIEREDLNAIEIANALHRICYKLELTQAKAAESIGWNEKTVAHYLRLLKLNSTVQDMIADKKLSFGHGKILASLGETEQLFYAHEIIKRGWSVRFLENVIKNKKKKKKPVKTNVDIKRLENHIQDTVCLPTKIKANKDGKGEITFSFTNLDQLDGLIAIIVPSTDDMY